MTVRERLILALDRPDRESALALAKRAGSYMGAYKVGLELITAIGPGILEELSRDGGRVFLDAKFHDIPNTVAGACRAAVKHGVWMLNVHASGGRAMLMAAAEAVLQESTAADTPPPILLAVTILTSLDRDLLNETLGVKEAPGSLALRMSRLTQDCGLDGVVASAQEAAAIREACGEDFVIVTPGARRAGSPNHDQKRVMTPANALAAGADYLVIGRDVTASPDPAAAARDLLQELR
ncbi:MAG TPA: orotidine-5'-phosphate decarboxylase [Armatimonadota bacterium]|nr:orotidine-5'-phosphate decarboxylase [Armatimonadota bacterium]